MSPCRCSLVAERLSSRAAGLELDALHMRQQINDLPPDTSPKVRDAKIAAKDLALAVAHELRDTLRDLQLDGAAAEEAA